MKVHVNNAPIAWIDFAVTAILVERPKVKICHNNGRIIIVDQFLFPNKLNQITYIKRN